MLLSRVVKSALVFEKEAIERYRSLKEKISDAEARQGIEHLLEEEEIHWRILSEAAAGKLDPELVEKHMREHLFENLASIAPLSAEMRQAWGTEIGKALAAEKETFIFYSNLRRMSKIPVVKKAFELLADMEKEHVEILSRLLG